MQIRQKEELRTRNLVLRSYEEKDIEALARLLENEEIAKTFMIPEYESHERYVELAGKLASFSKTSDTGHLEYGIFKDNNLIGFINDCGFDEEEIEIGYVIDPSYWGKGYATEAVKAVLEDLKEMGFKKVKAAYFEHNKASFRVMQKCGMNSIDYVESETYRGVEYRCLYCEKTF